MEPSITGARGAILWKAVLTEMRSLMTDANYAAWFAQTTVLGAEGETLTIGVPNQTHQHWLDCRLRPRIEAALARVQRGTVHVIFAVDS